MDENNIGIGSFILKGKLRWVACIGLWIVLLLIGYGAIMTIGPTKGDTKSYIENQIKSTGEKISNIKLGQINYTETGRAINFTGDLDGTKVIDVINYKKENNKWSVGEIDGIKNNKFVGMLGESEVKSLMKGNTFDGIKIVDTNEITLSSGTVNLVQGSASYKFKYIDKEIGVTNTLEGTVELNQGQLGWAIQGDYYNGKITSKLTSFTNSELIDLFVNHVENWGYSYQLTNVSGGVEKDQCKLVSSTEDLVNRTVNFVIDVSIPAENGNPASVERYTSKATIGVNGTEWKVMPVNEKVIQGSIWKI